MQNNLWHVSRRTQRSIDRSEDVCVEYPVCVISVAVLVAVVKRRIFLLVFVVLYNKRSIISVIQSFGVCLQIICVLQKTQGLIVMHKFVEADTSTY